MFKNNFNPIKSVKKVGDKIVTPWLTPPYGVVHRANNLYTLKPKYQSLYVMAYLKAEMCI